MSIEQNFNISFVAGLALREKQIQQNYRPIIAVHKWFARRPGTLFRALVLSEFGEGPVEDIFFEGNDFPDNRIADPFMGGGTPLIEANRVGCDVDGFDINPMAAWIVREEIEHLDLKAYAMAATGLLDALREKLQSLYVTDCPLYGDQGIPVKYWFWVKEIDCEACGEAVPLFPGYLLSEDVRHPQNVLVCPGCGQLNEVKNPLAPGACKECSKRLTLNGAARRGHCP
jgi:putative DNA methylase